MDGGRARMTDETRRVEAARRAGVSVGLLAGILVTLMAVTLLFAWASS